jgi:hypothetical protein
MGTEPHHARSSGRRSSDEDPGWRAARAFAVRTRGANALHMATKVGRDVGARRPAADDSSYVNGMELVVDGGMTVI